MVVISFKKAAISISSFFACFINIMHMIQFNLCHVLLWDDENVKKQNKKEFTKWKKVYN